MLNIVPLADAERETASDNVAPRNWLEELAVYLALQAEPVQYPGNHNPLPERIKNLGTFLASVNHYFEETNRSETAVSRSAEWMLDNFYIIEQTLRQVGEDISSDFYRRLPRLTINNQETARIYTLTFMLSKTHDSHLEMEHIKKFIEAFQSVTVLQIGENWALAPML